MEIDTQGVEEIDSYWSRDGKLLMQKQTANMLYVLDSLFNLVKLKQGKDGYENVLSVQIGEIDGLVNHLEPQLGINFKRISISDRAVTMDGVTYVYATGQKYEQLKSLEEKGWEVQDTQTCEFANKQIHMCSKNFNGSKKTSVILKQSINSRKSCFTGQRI